MNEHQLYREELLERARYPPHKGTVKQSDITINDTNPLCGDELCITAKINNSTVKDMKFIGEGCALSIAATSLLGDTIIGKTLKDIMVLQREDMEKLIGATVSVSRVKCITLGLVALKKGIIQYRGKHHV